MADRDPDSLPGDELVKRDLISREDLAQAQEREKETGKPWYRQLLDTGKVSFQAIEDVLRYEFHSSAQRAEHESLGDALVREGLLSQQHLKEALAEQKRTGRLLGRILVDLGYVKDSDRARILAKQYNMDFALLENTPSEREALESVPESIARKHQMIPVHKEGDRLSVLINDPQVRQRLNDAAVLLGLRIQPILTSVADINQELRTRYAAISEDHESAPQVARSVAKKSLHTLPESESPATTPQNAVAADKKPESPPMTEEPATKPPLSAAAIAQADASAERFDKIARQAAGASVVKMVATIIEGAVNSGATDVHLDPQDPEMRVRYRIDGVLHDVMSIPENLEAAVVSRVKILADLDITNTRLPQDGHISMEIGGREFDVRVATLPTFLGERVVLRLLDQSSVLSGIKDLGLEADDETVLLRAIDQPYGMILVTGPTGSGKTTTLYAALNQKNVMTDSIVTLEDPVEYQLSGINQVQIDPDINLTFANTLRAALRQDIDVLLVGEIRDAETARIAVRAAMTGHLVFSTLHTNDAPEAISTLRNMDVPSYLLSSALTAIVGQRLVRTICSQCRTEFKPDSALLRSIGLPLSVKKLYRGKGCHTCYNTGNRGRTGIFEIMEISGNIRKQIAANMDPQEIAAGAKLATMAMRCREKVRKGIVEPEEFLRVIRT